MGFDTDCDFSYENAKALSDETAGNPSRLGQLFHQWVRNSEPKAKYKPKGKSLTEKLNSAMGSGKAE